MYRTIFLFFVTLTSCFAQEPDFSQINSEYLSRFFLKMWYKEGNQTLTNNEINKLIGLIYLTSSWTSQLIQGHDFNKKRNDKVLRKTNPIVNGKPLYDFSNIDYYGQLTTHLNNKKDITPVLNLSLRIRIKERLPQFQNPLDFGRIACKKLGMSNIDGNAEDYSYPTSSDCL
ncbi:hypothetical protein, partial [Flammeovirga sp. OC4]|uniref:hypothetical protein n=1 Tax=Flammeovirga sp. OC4 TaxID=1382345 RepID=UPI0005C71397